MIFKGEFFFNLSVYFCFLFHLYKCCVFISVVCLNSITILEFFIFVKYLSNIEDNV